MNLTVISGLECSQAAAFMSWLQEASAALCPDRKTIWVENQTEAGCVCVCVQATGEVETCLEVRGVRRALRGRSVWPSDGAWLPKHSGAAAAAGAATRSSAGQLRHMSHSESQLNRTHVDGFSDWQWPEDFFILLLSFKSLLIVERILDVWPRVLFVF